MLLRFTDLQAKECIFTNATVMDRKIAVVKFDNFMSCNITTNKPLCSCQNKSQIHTRKKKMTTFTYRDAGIQKIFAGKSTVFLSKAEVQLRGGGGRAPLNLADQVTLFQQRGSLSRGAQGADLGGSEGADKVPISVSFHPIQCVRIFGRTCTHISHIVFTYILIIQIFFYKL